MSAPALALIMAETLVNRALRLDPQAGERFTALSGLVLGVRLMGVDAAFWLRFDADGVSLLREKPDAVDVTVSGPPLELLRLLLVQGSDPADFPDEVSITGDVAQAQRIKRTLDQLDLDWEEGLSRIVGDVAAHQLGNAVRGLGRWSRRSAETLLLDLGEYLTQEVHAAPASTELEAFALAVDLLRDDVERLERRVQRLAQSSGGEGE